jgi:hypothetical protein
LAKEKSNDTSDEELADDGFAMFARSFKMMINSSR